MRSIRDYKQTENRAKTDSEPTERAQVDALFGKYAGKSEEELMRELMSRVSNAKRDGSFDAQSLEAFVTAVSPQLDDKSRQKLISLVGMINGDSSF